MTKEQNIKAIKDLLDQQFTNAQKTVIINNVAHLVQEGPFFEEDNIEETFPELFTVLLRYYDDPFYDAEHLADFKDFSFQRREFEAVIEEAKTLQM